ncbi:Uncharacterised protein [Chlamydia trachomatis]|nr:Uncharacterised protein [Chlamydia trachomatis]
MLIMNIFCKVDLHHVDLVEIGMQRQTIILVHRYTPLYTEHYNIKIHRKVDCLVCQELGILRKSAKQGCLLATGKE